MLFCLSLEIFIIKNIEKYSRQAYVKAYSKKSSWKTRVASCIVLRIFFFRNDHSRKKRAHIKYLQSGKLSLIERKKEEINKIFT